MNYFIVRSNLQADHSVNPDMWYLEIQIASVYFVSYFAMD